MKKLLHKTLGAYIIFSAIILVVSVPVFWLATERLFIEDADEALLLRKDEFKLSHMSKLSEQDIGKWNLFNRDIKIFDTHAIPRKDSIFYKSFYDTLANEIEPYRVLLSPITVEGNSYALMVRLNLVESRDIVIQLAILFSTVMVLLLTGLYLITRRLSARIWKPFYTTLGQAEQFELDKEVPALPLTDVEEFTRLNHALNKLMERNRVVYRNQKEFIENAAHELQTPVAAFQAKLDALAQQLPFTEGVAEKLTDLNDTASRLNRINKNLLLLSRIENNQYPVVERVALHDILKRQIDFLTEQAEERVVGVHLKFMEPVVINANSTLVEIAFGNLLLNSLRYNVERGEIQITLLQSQLRITNTGPERALNEKKLFQRFSSVGTGGNGLGLSIVKKICDLHNWEITYEFKGNWHTFEVRFSKF